MPIPKQEQKLILRELNFIDRAIEPKTALLLKMKDTRREPRNRALCRAQIFHSSQESTQKQIKQKNNLLFSKVIHRIIH
jgi:hypothetical protein